MFVNGKWVGVHREPATLVRTLRELRRKMDVNTEVGVVHDIRLKELRLYTDYGRCCRPLYIVEETEEGPMLRIRKGHVRRLKRDQDVEEGNGCAKGCGGRPVVFALALSCSPARALRFALLPRVNGLTSRLKSMPPGPPRSVACASRDAPPTPPTRLPAGSGGRTWWSRGASSMSTLRRRRRP